MKCHLKLLLTVAICTNLSVNGMIVRLPEREPKYASVLRYVNDCCGNDCLDNISFSYHTARKVCEEACRKNVNVENKYLINTTNVLRCMRQFFAIQPEQFSDNLTKYDAMCVTLNHLGISSFDEVNRKLIQLKIHPSQIVFLDLNFNNLKSIEKNDLSNFSNLQVLKVACNQISFIHPGSLDGTKISILEVAQNQIKNIFKCLRKVKLSPTVPFLINSTNNPIIREEKQSINNILDQFLQKGYDTIRFFSVDPNNGEQAVTMIAAIFSSHEINTVIKKIYLSYFSSDICLQNLVMNNGGIIQSQNNLQLPKKYRIKDFNSYFRQIKSDVQVVLKSSIEQRLFLCYTLFYLKEQNNVLLRNFVKNNLNKIMQFAIKSVANKR